VDVLDGDDERDRENRRVPSLWRESVVVPVSKKQVSKSGECDVNTFWGISLTLFGRQGSMQDPGKQAFKHGRRKGLIMEEQGGV